MSANCNIAKQQHDAIPSNKPHPQARETGTIYKPLDRSQICNPHAQGLCTSPVDKPHMQPLWTGPIYKSYVQAPGSKPHQQARVLTIVIVIVIIIVTVIVIVVVIVAVTVIFIVITIALYAYVCLSIRQCVYISPTCRCMHPSSTLSYVRAVIDARNFRNVRHFRK